MKPGKTLLIIFVIIVVLVGIAYLVGQSNKKKTAAALAGQPNANPDVTGRYIAQNSSLTSDYSVIDPSGKAVWVWAGTNPCPRGYGKVLSGPDAGWCKLLGNTKV